MRRSASRGNPGLMIGGIVLASAAPIVLGVGVATLSCSSDGGGTRCDIGDRVVAFGLISLAMIGAAIPMIVIGAKRVAAAIARTRTCPRLIRGTPDQPAPLATMCTE